MALRSLVSIVFAITVPALSINAAGLQRMSLGSHLGDGFEEYSVGGRAYVWRSAGNTVRLTDGATAVVTVAGGETCVFHFARADPRVHPEGQHELFRTTAYIGKTVQSTLRFESVRYRQVYPGIDVVFVLRDGRLEYRIELARAADVVMVRIVYAGATIHALAGGDLRIVKPGLVITQAHPQAFQGARKVDCRYQWNRAGEVTVRLGKYDPGLPLLIDPVLNFSTYLGGSSFDAAYAVVADSAGNVYVAGETSSAALTGGIATVRSSRDAFVAKLDSTGTQLVWATYIGGSQYDSARGIAIDSAGALYVTGMTNSVDFPATTGAFATQNSGGYDAFVAKLNTSGSVVYATYFGGTGNDEGNAIAVDSSGSAYIAGQTTSSTSLPVSQGALQLTYGGGLSDCFVSKFNSSGSAIVYSTFLGGNGLDLCRAITVNSSGDAYVAGSTYSANFPSTLVLGPGTGGDAFAVELNSAGSAPVYSVVFGGTSVDDANAIVVDSTGAAYIAGDTSSIDFPVTAGAFQSALKGAYNAFAAKLNAAGSALTYATLYGGSVSDTANAIAVDQLGQAILAGYTLSPDLATLDPLQAVEGGNNDAFVVVLGATGHTLSFASYFGGLGDDRAFALATLAGNRIYVAGYTSSSNFPVAPANQRTYSGAYDAFALEVTYGTGSGGLLFVPLTPCRIVDTRNSALGQFGPPYLSGGTKRVFPLPASPCNIPATAVAYSLNITALPRNGTLQYLSAWPAGLPFPGVSTLNALDGRVAANAALLGAGINGAITILASDDTDVLVDINGYFGSSSNPLGLGFYPKTPCRIADTRYGQGFTGAFGPPSLATYTKRDFPILSSSCPIPSSAQAYSLNFTAFPVNGQPLGFLSVWPAGEPYPGVSTLNSSNGSVVANAALVPGGKAPATVGAIRVLASDPTDLVIDYDGYFGPPATGSLTFYPITPCRVVDTRASQNFPAPFGPPSLVGGVTRSFPLLASPCGIPAAAQAYALNVTALPPGPLQFVSVWPADKPFPGVSTLNAPTGTIVANAAIVPAGTGTGAGAGGAIKVHASDATDIILDIVGYFAP